MTTLTKKETGTTFPTFVQDFFNTDRFFGPGWLDLDRLNGFGNTTVPSVNITENKDSYSLEMAAPGLEKKDFKINVENNVMTISAEKESKTEEKKDDYHRREFSYQSFSRSFTLPEQVNAEGIKASYENGILKLQLPKKENSAEAARKRIDVA